MKYRPLGDTGISVSELALGTMHFGGETEFDEAEAMVRRCLDVGINHFDCADVYNAGAAEEVLGRLLAPVRDEVVIATKYGFGTGPGPNDHGASGYHLRQAVAGSLRRLGTDRIDLLYLHRFDSRASTERILEALTRVVADGDVLYVGMSNIAAWQLALMLGRAELANLVAPVAIQPMYNLVKRQVEVELLPLAEHADLAVFPYSPLGGGLFTGRYDTGRGTDGRLAANDMYRRRYADESQFEVAARVSELAAELGCHPATLAIAWVGGHRNVTAPLIGAKSVEQLEPSLAAIDFEMDDELRARVSALSPEPPPPTDRSENTDIT